MYLVLSNLEENTVS